MPKSILFFFFRYEILYSSQLATRNVNCEQVNDQSADHWTQFARVEIYGTPLKMKRPVYFLSRKNYGHLRFYLIE